MFFGVGVHVVFCILLLVIYIIGVGRFEILGGGGGVNILTFIHIHALAREPTERSSGVC